MAITTYADLQAAAANWLVRNDLNARIVEFITLAEVRINRVLHARRAESTTTLAGVPASRYVALPPDYAEPRELWFVIDGQERPKTFREPAQMEASDQQAEPELWGIDGTNIAFERPCDQAYAIRFRYLANFQLSDASPTNAILTQAPDVYLFGTLAEAAPFLRDPDLASAYEAKWSRAVKEMNLQERKSKSRQPLRTELAALSTHHGYDIRTGC